MLGVNVTGVFMTAQAAAKQMIRFGNGGSIVLIASMSGTIANRVCLPLASPLHPRVQFRVSMLIVSGTYLPGLQCLQSRCAPAGSKPRQRMGPVWHPREHHLPRLYRHCHGGRPLRNIPRKENGVAEAEYARSVESAARV
jgi:hypothetical protein